MHLVLKTVLGLLLSYAVYYFAYLFNKFVLIAFVSPLRRLPGPKSRGLLANHLGYVMDPHWSPAAHDQWTRRFGKTFVIKGFNWFDNRLITLDPRTISHILNHPGDYEKPWPSRRLLSSLIGEGLLAAEGQHHHRQRKVMNPAFSASNLRALTPVFFRKAYELRDKWLSLMPDKEVGERFNVAHWLSRVTFDVIGIAGFGYEFNAIHEENEEVYLAYKVMFERTINQGQTLKAALLIYFPWLAHILPDENIRINRQSQATIYKAGKALVERKKQEFADGNTEAKDLLSLLVRSNMSSEIEPSQRISDRDISNQINTFLFAGSDTTSLAITWTLLLLAQNPAVQDVLRAELLSIDTSESELDGKERDDAEFFSQIDQLTLLNNVCREVLRLIPPVHSSIRVALKDDILPISAPLLWERVEIPGKGNGGGERGVKIKRGEFIHVAIEGLNLDKTVWGEDAWEFKPDRWNNLPEAVRSQPGLFSNLMTFGYGPRACIGMKFSMMEMKTILFVLLRTFTFNDPPEVNRVSVIITRPFIKGKRSEGSQLPLLIRPIQPQTMPVA